MARYDFDRLFAHVKAQMKQVTKANSAGFYQAFCPFPDHDNTKTRAFSFSTQGFRCFGCEKHGNLLELAREMGIAIEPYSISSRLDEREAMARLMERGLRASTIEEFGIVAVPAKQGWIIPIGVEKHVKYKHFDSSHKPKTWWHPKKPASGADIFNLERNVGQEEVWLVEGEPDACILHQVGLPAVSFTGGATNPSFAGAQAMADAGIKRVNVCYDNDRAGQIGATQAFNMLTSVGLEAVIRVLPEESGEVVDVTDLYRVLDRDDARMREAVAKLPFRDESLSVDGESTAKEADDWTQPIPLREVNVPAFPMEVLASWIGERARQVCAMLQTPTDLGGMLALAVLSTALAKKVVVRVRQGWTEAVNLYLIAALKPGEGKSPVFKAMIDPVEQFELEEKERMASSIRDARNEQEVLEARLKKQKTAASAADDRADRARLLEEVQSIQRELDCCIVPAEPRMLADDATPESLTSLLAANNARMAILDAEGGLINMMAGQYSRVPNISVYLKAHSGDNIRVDRKGRPSELVHQPALTVGLAVQPAKLAGLMNGRDFHGAGLLGRFLFSIPASKVGSRIDLGPVADTEVARLYERNVLTLLRIPIPTALDGRPIPHVLELSLEAATRLAVFRAWLEPQLGEYGRLGYLGDWCNKLVGHVARIAGLLHMAEHVGHPSAWVVPVGLETVERAILLGEYLIPHAQAAYGMMGADEHLSNAEYVWGWIARNGTAGLTARDIFEGTKARMKKMAALRPVLCLLVEHGYLRELPLPERTGGGRPPSQGYAVNPHALSQYSQKSQKAPG
jgi:replicative DNA helicase